MDESTEPSNFKMARLRQCLTGNALEAIRGLGVTAPEYEEANFKRDIKIEVWWCTPASASLHGSTGTDAIDKK